MNKNFDINIHSHLFDVKSKLFFKYFIKTEHDYNGSDSELINSKFKFCD